MDGLFAPKPQGEFLGAEQPLEFNLFLGVETGVHRVPQRYESIIGVAFVGITAGGNTQRFPIARDVKAWLFF